MSVETVVESIERFVARQRPNPGFLAAQITKFPAHLGFEVVRQYRATAIATQKLPRFVDLTF